MSNFGPMFATGSIQAIVHPLLGASGTPGMMSGFISSSMTFSNADRDRKEALYYFQCLKPVDLPHEQRVALYNELVELLAGEEA